jgi:hypothetical protein
MKILIANLPPRITELELLELLKPYRKRDGLHLQIVDQTSADGVHHYYAVADLSHERLAEKALKKLNGKLLRSSQLRLREFQHRNYSNERRALGWRNRAWSAKERRLKERRRQTRQQVDELDELFSGEAVSSAVEVDEIRITAHGDLSRKI